MTENSNKLCEQCGKPLTKIQRGWTRDPLAGIEMNVSQTSSAACVVSAPITVTAPPPESIFSDTSSSGIAEHQGYSSVFSRRYGNKAKIRIDEYECVSCKIKKQDISRE